MFAKRFIYLLLCVIAITGCDSARSSPDQSNLSGWVGEYCYDELLGYTFGETPISAVYTMEIYEENDEYYALVKADGWMLGIRARAKVRGDENSIDIIFWEHDTAEYEPMFDFDEGEILFRLIRKEQGILTQWIGIPESGIGDENEIYFIKKDDN